MGFTDETVRFNLDDSNRKEISETLKDVYLSLDEKGYNPINQIVGYVLSGDPAYVPEEEYTEELWNEQKKNGERNRASFSMHK